MCKSVHCKKAPKGSFKYGGRPSIYGNPFNLVDTSSVSERQSVIDSFAQYFYDRVESDPEFKKAVLSLKGMVEVRRKNKKIASLGAGNIVGELALLDNGPRTAKIVCLTDCETLAISRKNFHKLLIEIPTLSVKILHGLASRIRKQNDYTL